MSAIRNKIFLACYEPSGALEGVISFTLTTPPDQRFRYGQRFSLYLDDQQAGLPRITTGVAKDATQTPDGSVMLATYTPLAECMSILERMEEVTELIIAKSSPF